MPDSSDIGQATRRGVLKATAGALGVAAMGGASAHEWGSGAGSTGLEGASPSATDAPGGHSGATPVGYHSLGGVGSESSRAGSPRHPHYGGRTEIRTHGDYAYVALFSSDSPTPGRGMAIVDISSYNDASTDEEAAAANMSVVSFLRNNTDGGAVMDLKVADDGQYVFLGTQPYTALFSTPGQDDSPESALHKIETNEANDPTPNTDDHSGTVAPGAVVAVDVSDKGNPQTVGAVEVSGTGVHNLYHHRIDGQDYVFAIHDLNDGTEGMYVFEFDRSTGQLEPVNRWSISGDTSQGELNPDMLYIHDVEVQDDPVTGRPTAYLAYWGAGLQVLDVSNPADISLLGHFDMNGTGRCHFASPAPELVETSAGTKRLCVASHETPAATDDEDGTGNVYLVDASGIYDADDGVLSVDLDGTTDAGVPRLADVGVWEWQKKSGSGDDIQFGNFELSPHNSDVAVHGGDLWVHQAHYHGGVRFLKLVDDGSGGLSLAEQGFSRPRYDVPDESKMQGLTEVTPNVWGAVESNGVTFASDINQGVHAVRADGVGYGGAPPSAAEVSTGDDGTVFTAGQTDQIDLAVEFLGRYDGVRVRDRIPSSWTVVGGDDLDPTVASADRVNDDGTYDVGGQRAVEFAGVHGVGDGGAYFAEAPAESGAYAFGPVEVSTDGGDTWYAVPGTLRSNNVVGVGTNVALGTAAGATGLLAHQRDRIAGRLDDLLDRGE